MGSKGPEWTEEEDDEEEETGEDDEAREREETDNTPPVMLASVTEEAGGDAQRHGGGSHGSGEVPAPKMAGYSVLGSPGSLAPVDPIAPVEMQSEWAYVDIEKGKFIGRLRAFLSDTELGDRIESELAEADEKVREFTERLRKMEGGEAAVRGVSRE